MSLLVLILYSHKPTLLFMVWVFVFAKAETYIERLCKINYALEVRDLKNTKPNPIKSIR